MTFFNTKSILERLEMAEIDPNITNAFTDEDFGTKNWKPYFLLDTILETLIVNVDGQIKGTQFFIVALLFA